MPELLRLESVHTHIAQYHILQGGDLMVPEGDVPVRPGRNSPVQNTTPRTILSL